MLVLVLLFGPVGCSHPKPLHKCCPIGQQWLVNESFPITCGTAKSTFRLPPVYSSLGVLSSNKIDLVYEPLVCNYSSSLLPDQFEEERYQILDSGRLIYLNGKSEEDFCLESVNDNPDPNVFVCIDVDNNVNKKSVEFLLLSIGSGLSFFSLLALLFVYAIIEELHNSPGKLLMNHALALALAFLVLFFNHIGGSHIQGDNFCCILVLQQRTEES